MKPKRGETIFFSAVSGAVGHMVGQLAQRKAGLYVCSWQYWLSRRKIDLLLNKLGYDAAFNYNRGREPCCYTRSESAALAALICTSTTSGGGKMLDAVLENMNSFGRIAVSGMVSQYDAATKDGLCSLGIAVSKRITMQGFLQSDCAHFMPQFMDLMVGYLKENKVVYSEDFAPGLDYASNAMCRATHMQAYMEPSKKYLCAQNDVSIFSNIKPPERKHFELQGNKKQLCWP